MLEGKLVGARLIAPSQKALFKVICIPCTCLIFVDDFYMHQTIKAGCISWSVIAFVIVTRIGSSISVFFCILTFVFQALKTFHDLLI